MNPPEIKAMVMKTENLTPGEYDKLREHLSEDFLNPDYAFAVTATVILKAALAGDLDLNEMARRELLARGVKV